jgi:hypothetical protein
MAPVRLHSVVGSFGQAPHSEVAARRAGLAEFRGGRVNGILGYLKPREYLQLLEVAGKLLPSFRL